MREASRIILDGFELSTDVEVVQYPERFMDADRGARMWNTVQRLLPDEASENESFPESLAVTCLESAPPCDHSSVAAPDSSVGPSVLDLETL